MLLYSQQYGAIKPVRHILCGLKSIMSCVLLLIRSIVGTVWHHSGSKRIHDSVAKRTSSGTSLAHRPTGRSIII